MAREHPNASYAVAAGTALVVLPGSHTSHNVKAAKFNLHLWIMKFSGVCPWFWWTSEVEQAFSFKMDVSFKMDAPG